MCLVCFEKRMILKPPATEGNILLLAVKSLMFDMERGDINMNPLQQQVGKGLSRYNLGLPFQNRYFPI